MKKPLKIIFLLLAVAMFSSLWAWHVHGKNSPERNKIRVSGNIEATQVRLAFRVQGRIKELLKDEGQPVKTLEVVARLDTDELEKIKNEAEASLKASQFAFERARDDYARAENLLTAGAISAQKRDAAKTAADSAKANADAMQAGLDLALTRLGFAELASPIEGFILSKSAEPGEVIPGGAAVFSVADLRNIWLTAYVNETDLGRVKLNQPVEVKTDTYPGKIYRGHISFISQEAEFTPKQIQTAQERVKLVYRIKVALDNTGMELKPGMPADALIITQ